MRRLLFVAVVAIGAFPFACKQGPSKGKFLPIVLDDWWNVDYVKEGCERAAELAKDGNPYAKPCPLESTPESIVREFESELEVAFASEAACQGLSLSHLSPEMANEAVKSPNAPATGGMAKVAGAHWMLILDLDGHSDTQEGQGWSLVDSANHVLGGRIATPQRVMQEVCRIVRGEGGKVEN